MCEEVQDGAVNSKQTGTSPVVQWLRLHAPNAGGPGLIPGRGTRSRMLQLRPGTAENICVF